MALAVGIVIGSLNGVLVVRLGINAFIVTLASYIFVRGMVVALSGGRSVYGLPDAMRVMAVERFLGIPLLAWMLILTYVVFALILTKTPFGRHLFLIGGNATAAFRAGIKVGGAVLVTFILSGALAGFAGWLLASRTAGATANLGIGMLFQAFAAVVIGGVSLKGGYGRLSGVFAGVLLLSSIQTAINVMGMPPHYTQMIQGGLVLGGSSPRHAQDHHPQTLSLGGRLMPGRLEGKVAVVVGAARGIGEGIAERFIEEGAHVVIGDTEVEAGRATAARLGAAFRDDRHHPGRACRAGSSPRRSHATAGSTSPSRTPASTRGG